MSLFNTKPDDDVGDLAGDLLDDEEAPKSNPDRPELVKWLELGVVGTTPGKRDIWVEADVEDADATTQVERESAVFHVAVFAAIAGSGGALRADDPDTVRRAARILRRAVELADEAQRTMTKAAEDE